MNAVDTNVLVYLVDADEPAKQAQARELMDRLAIGDSLPRKNRGRLIQ